jgi:signal transduction histidine kinase
VAVTADLHGARRLPSWLGSIRFRMALLYSLVLFGLAALLVAGIYWGSARALADTEITQQVTQVQQVPGGVIISEQQVVDGYLLIEREANARALDTLRTYSFAALGGLFVASLFVGWFVAGRVLRPIDHITDVARDIQATDLSRRIALEGPDDELRRLAETFDGMLDRLDEAFDTQQQFIHEASHELRNPLATIRTNLEVVLADPDADEAELRRIAEVVGRSADRMSRLVDDLLVYARHGQRRLERERVDLGVLAAEVADEFAADASRRALDLVVDVGGPVVVDGDRLALRQAATNLVANALRFGPQGSSVTLSAGTEGAWSWLGVADEGPGIDPDDRERVFQRFWRGEDGGGDGPRSGLGLTIVRQVAEAHGGEVKVGAGDASGATIALWIPAGDATRADGAPSTPGL